VTRIFTRLDLYDDLEAHRRVLVVLAFVRRWGPATP
jgi:hypothetical protein